MKGKFRFFIISMFTMIVIENFIDRASLSYAQKFILQEYGLNAGTWGQVLGLFECGYISSGFFGGLLANKKGPNFFRFLDIY